MERYEIAIAAERAGASVDELRHLVELGILQPDGDGRFSDGDVRRVGVVHSVVAASIPLDLLASALRSGDLSFDFIDDPAYSLFASFTNETFEELSARTGVPMHLLVALREATGSGVPDPASRVREDEMAIVPAIEFQLARGFRPIIVERHLRVMGDSLRRIAESSGDVWRSEVMEPLFAAGQTVKQVGAASNEVSRAWTPLDAAGAPGDLPGPVGAHMDGQHHRRSGERARQRRAARSPRPRAGHVLPRRHRVHPPHPGAW